MTISKIVVTGGPCAGKTAGLKRIRKRFTEMGYAVLIVPETATALITNGISPMDGLCIKDFQQILEEMQLAKEQACEEAARKLDAEKVLIVCDRGLMDTKAFLTEEEFAEIKEELALNDVEMRDRYDAVFHLVTAAKGAEAFYSSANNSARTETVEEAAASDDRLIAAWTGTPHLRVIDNRYSKEEKKEQLLTEIAKFLGEPEPLEIERKYLIRYPDLQAFEQNPFCKKVEIEQVYLKTDDGTNARIRRRGADGHYLYFETKKTFISGIKCIEEERRISKDEYEQLMEKADPERHPIVKDRYCLVFDSQYFEIDVYPFWKDQAVMEIELLDELQEVRLPDMIEVIRDVTNEPEYKNSALAKRF